jgi:hypothetical protein
LTWVGIEEFQHLTDRVDGDVGLSMPVTELRCTSFLAHASLSITVIPKFQLSNAKRAALFTTSFGFYTIPIGDVEFGFTT